LAEAIYTNSAYHYLIGPDEMTKLAFDLANPSLNLFYQSHSSPFFHHISAQKYSKSVNIEHNGYRIAGIKCLLREGVGVGFRDRDNKCPNKAASIYDFNKYKQIN